MVKQPKVLSLKHAKHPRNGVTLVAIVQSVSRPNRVNHTVTKQGNSWLCSCERSIIGRESCRHIARVKARLARQKAAK